MCDVSGWFLPDKAIGLVDGHARCRTDSELVKENAVLALKALLEGGAVALQQKANDNGAAKTTALLAGNGKELVEKLRGLQAAYEAERGGSAGLKALAEKNEQLRHKAETTRDVSVNADRQYYAIPEDEKKPGELEAWTADAQTFKVRVTPELIEEVVSQRTGIAVARSSQNERMQPLHPADDPHKRVVGQVEAVTAVAEAVWAEERPGSDGELPLPGPERRREDGDRKALAAQF